MKVSEVESENWKFIKIAVPKREFEITSTKKELKRQLTLTYKLCASAQTAPRLLWKLFFFSSDVDKLKIAQKTFRGC